MFTMDGCTAFATPATASSGAPPTFTTGGETMFPPKAVVRSCSATYVTPLPAPTPSNAARNTAKKPRPRRPGREAEGDGGVGGVHEPGCSGGIQGADGSVCGNHVCDGCVGCDCA